MAEFMGEVNLFKIEIGDAGELKSDFLSIDKTVRLKMLKKSAQVF